ncbi:MAG: hypothetical protein SF069_17125 [Phycisphaerae bacterium]|nr:hypothetical protein [Phycisphaerae bacterium]
MFGIALAITLILCGVLAAANLIIAKRPDAAAAIEKLTPIRGWVGLFALVWGLWALLTCVLNIGGLLKATPIWGITFLAAALVQSAVGFLLCYPLLAKHVFAKSGTAQEHAAGLLTRLAPHQANLGVASIVLGAWSVLAQFAF